MLLVEVVVPALGRQYDFELEETAKIDVLIREMAAVICQKERCQFIDNEQGLSLYSQAYGTRLLPEAALWECGVENGQRLILV